MDFGNVLAAIESKFGDEVLTIAGIARLFDAGKLSPLLPDACCWFVHVDRGGNVESIEPVTTSELRKRHAFITQLDGQLVTFRGTPGQFSFELSAQRFPLCELAQHKEVK